MRTLVLIFTISVMACTSSRVPSGPSEKSLSLLGLADGRLAWAGLSLGMTRSRAERTLGQEIVVRHERYNAEMCGDYYSELEVKGREVRISWSRADAEGVIEVLAIPYIGGERLANDSDLSRWASESVPQLINPHVEPGDLCPPVQNSFLVLRQAPDDALNLKSSGEGVFFLTATGCVD